MPFCNTFYAMNWIGYMSDMHIAGCCVVHEAACDTCRAVARNMDSEAVEHSIQEATASVRENISLVERSLINLEEHTG